MATGRITVDVKLSFWFRVRIQILRFYVWLCWFSEADAVVLIKVWIKEPGTFKFSVRK